ncbi:hypothetical protein LTR56_023062 [Elasticomyces elasticus]|nr:hypothetical protein LTR56_023062 [Elasticomyces elasticus]KAK3623339.1 hypothetical protein LTR22_024418 [Elasticomyces elasticus]KAK4907299.1 hypothetical protein LTR49_023669 [Elasticomyces elasticus]KAK5747777.1 hypothetical protein LTS12_022176 [Elasticomyces elasticus]
MFTLPDLTEDDQATSDIVEDVREEGEIFSKVANVTLFDKEEDGIVTIRFTDVRAATACMEAFHRRWCDNRRIVARKANATKRFQEARKSVKQKEQEEKQRLEAFSREIKKDYWSLACLPTMRDRSRGAAAETKVLRVENSTLETCTVHEQQDNDLCVTAKRIRPVVHVLHAL